MKYLSLFSGIGGFELGIIKAYENLPLKKKKERVGKENEKTLRIQEGEFNNERDKRLDSSGTELQQHIIISPTGQPTCIGFSEIDKYAIQIYQKHFPEHKNYGDCTKINVSELPDFDLLVGGFPCQAFSIAGKRRGFDDTRGTLFFDIARILKEKRPRNFILENVKGLLSHDNGRTFKTIISTLVELGYCVEWQVLNAKNFGVPQNRERVFIVGHFGGIPKRKVFPITESNGTHLKEITSGVSDAQRIYRTDGLAKSQKALGGGLGAKTGLYAIPVLTPDRPEKRQNGRRFKTDGEVAFTQTAQDRHGIYDGLRIRRLTPLECERLMGYPDRWTEGLSDTQRYKTLGNGVVSNVVAEVVKRLF